MIESINALLPDLLSASESWFLILLAGFTSLLTATLGIGGGREYFPIKR